MSARGGHVAQVVAILLLVSAVGGCGGTPSGDKAGGGEPPITLTLGSPDSEGSPGTDALRHFVAQVADLSDGRITVDLRWNAAHGEEDIEGAVIHEVRDGRLDLGWVGTRAWDGQGVVGFSALQAPFLISDYGVLAAVMTSDLPDKMMAELDGIGLTGLGVYPDQLRHPFGFRAPFLSLDDFDGVGLRVPQSQVSDAVMRALGATPLDLNGNAFGEAIDKGEVVGAETSIGTVLIGNAGVFPEGAYMTMNLTFYPKLQTLFTESDHYTSLSANTRSVLETAAGETLTYLLGKDLEPMSEIQAFCDAGGALVNASRKDLDEIAAATQPVTHALEAEASVADYIAQIRELKSSVAPALLTVCPT